MLMAVAEAREACKGKKSLPARVKAAMRATKHHWMITDENKQFQVAVAAVLVESDEKDKERITEEMTALETLNSMLSGVPINEIKLKVPKKPLKLMQMWSDLK